jgi:hypothetical protein
MDYDKSIELMLHCISNGFKPFIAPVISLSSVTGQSVLIRTSHPSGSRQLPGLKNPVTQGQAH